MFRMVTTIYEHDRASPAPTRNEVLICHSQTTTEEVGMAHLVTTTV